MKFVQQKASFSVREVGCGDQTGNAPKRHGVLLPDSIRCLIAGPSNCGKTNLMICLLEDKNGLRFKNVYVYSKSLHQPKYEYLKRVLEGVDGIGYFPYSENAHIVEPQDALPDSIFIFDDIACENLNTVRKYFSMGRHSRVDSFFLCQSYTRVPKHLIRDNANLIILFKQDALNLKHVYDDHVGGDMPFDKFCKLCSACWNDGRYGHLVIDKDSPIDSGRYRKGFDKFVSLD